ncbi:YhgE/Pip domain-containing protein [Paenibacillus sp. y28]|uniref:YhgE/Pip domain-containing protein n=1 Tax=Paenibacillus sp. y28 TaxID=3129110 RepID=UPI00301A1F67
MKTIKPIVSIYTQDLKKIVTNWAAAIILSGLVCLPSLYAWFNILASWDPYSNTAGLAIAVASNDEGAEIRGKPVNLGNEIIASLQDNHTVGWTFVHEREAMDGVQHGDYYAAIVIPADFSARIATVLSDNPRKAEIDYFVNEKINAIAPKITAKGASGISDEVSRSFVKTANGIIFSMMNEIGVELEAELPTIQKVRDLIFKLESLFPQMNAAVNTGLDEIGRTNAIVDQAQTHLPLVADLAQAGSDAAARLEDLLDQTDTALDAISPGMKQDLLYLQQAAEATEQLTVILQGARFVPSLASAELERMDRRLNAALGVTGRMMALFDRLHGLTGLSGTAPVTSKLQQVENNLQQQELLVSQIKQAVDKGQQPADQLIASLNQLSKDTSARISDLLNRYDSEIQPEVQQGIDRAKQASRKAHTLMDEAARSIPDVKQVLDNASSGLAAGKQELERIRENLPAVEAKIHRLAERIRAFEQEDSLNEIIDLLKNDAQRESEFFAEPVVVKENKLFPIPNYGSGMSPFFTTLSLWVGALLLVSLLSVEVHHPGSNYRSYQVYFGRYMTFATLAVLQSVLCTLGDIYLLGTFVAEKLWFVLFGMLLSAVFMLVVYTLVSVFGNVGKAMAIVLLVLQLAGSGGTFPIQLTPPFFQAVHPYLPFTYAISLMREAVGGMLWDIVLRDLLMMGMYVGLTLVIGLALKTWINQKSARLVEKAKESGLLH